MNQAEAEVELRKYHLQQVLLALNTRRVRPHQCALTFGLSPTRSVAQVEPGRKRPMLPNLWKLKTKMSQQREGWRTLNVRSNVEAWACVMKFKLKRQAKRNKAANKPVVMQT